MEQMILNLVFYLFSAILLVSATMVIVARNPVHSVLYLIICFFNAAGLFVLLGAEFVAMILLIVYVGAVAVLFLFVVMMLDIDFKELHRGFSKHLSMGLAVASVLLAELLFIIAIWPERGAVIASAVLEGDNTRALGRILYTNYVYPFQVSGLILLVAMVGAIVLTMRERKGRRRQNLSHQLNRKASDVIKLKKVELREGVR